MGRSLTCNHARNNRGTLRETDVRHAFSEDIVAHKNCLLITSILMVAKLFNTW